METKTNAIEVMSEVIGGKRLVKMTLSNILSKDIAYFKTVIEPKQSKGKMYYQISLFYDTKVKHENIYDKNDLIIKLLEFFTQYKQWDIITSTENIKILINKNETCRIIRKALKAPVENIVLPHNKEKNYIICEGVYVDWLYRLGIMNKQGKVLADKQKKFRQINRFLETIDGISAQIPDNALILDVGCGKSYLTFALYYYFNVIHNKNVQIIGLDLKEDVVSYCQKLSDSFGFKDLNFYVQDIEEFDLKDMKYGSGKVPTPLSMVVTLHACDTATDYALFNAIKQGAEIILSVPCCQHELFSQIKNQDANPVLKHGILKERLCAVLTDALRGELLSALGYKCAIMEFIDMEHTSKNVLIKAVKKKVGGFDNASFDAYVKLAGMYNVKPKLFKLLQQNGYIAAE